MRFEIYTCEHCQTDNEFDEPFPVCNGCGHTLNYEPQMEEKPIGGIQ